MNLNNLNTFQHYFYDYGRFHNNKVNILIHIFCIPLILFTLLKFLEHFSLQIGLSWSISIPLLVLFFFVYIRVDVLLSFCFLILFSLLDILTFKADFSAYSLSSLQILTLIHVTAWILQFIGHGFYERRAPALTTNLLLTVNAPLFVLIELAYFLFNYRGKEIDGTKEYVEKDIKQYKNE